MVLLWLVKGGRKTHAQSAILEKRCRYHMVEKQPSQPHITQLFFLTDYSLQLVINIFNVIQHKMYDTKTQNDTNTCH